MHSAGALTPQHDREFLGRAVAFVVLGIACAEFFLQPLALFLVVCLFAVVSPTKDFKWLFLLSACILITLLNIPKQLDDDLSNYIVLQDYTSAKPFFVLFNKDELREISGTYRVTEIGFYAPLWLLAQVIPDSSADLAIIATVGIYVPVFLALTLIGEEEKWSKGLVLMVACFTFFAGLNFVQSTHLIRQYISASLLFLAFALYLCNRHGWSMIVVLYACTVHNGTAPLVPAVGAACWLFRYRQGRKFGMGGILVRFFAMLLVIAGMIAAVPFLYGFSLKEDVPNIHAGHFIAVGTLFIVAHIAIQMRHLHLKSLYYARIAFIAVYVLSLGFFVLGLPLFALRYFAYLEWLYGLLVGAIMFKMFDSKPRVQVIARLTVAIAAAGILITRIALSEFSYGAGDNYFLSWNFFEVMQSFAR